MLAISLWFSVCVLIVINRRFEFIFIFSEENIYCETTASYFTYALLFVPHKVTL